MLHPFRSLRRLLAVSCFAALCAVGVVTLASADQVMPDGDTADNGNSPVSFGPSADYACTTSAPGAIKVKYNGAAGQAAQHYKAGESLDVTFAAEKPGISAQVVGTPSVPDPWNSTSADFPIAFTTSIGSSVPDGSYKVYVDVKGAAYSAKDDAGGRPFFKVDVACGNITPPADDAPVVTYVGQTPDANGNGWNNSPVTVRWQVTSAGAYAPASGSDCGSDADGDDVWEIQLSADSADTTGTPLTCAVALVADATKTGSDSHTVFLDQVAPVVAVTGIGSSPYTLNGTPAPAPGCDTTDALSGVDTPASLGTITGLNLNGVGTATVPCGGAVDLAGNAQAPDPKTGTYEVRYPQTAAGTCVILQPINCDNTSVFSRGKSVPVKFKIPGFTTAQMAALDPSSWRVNTGSQACNIVPVNTVNEDQTTTSNQGGSAPRWDATGGQFVYNADLRSYAAGTCWRINVTLDDGPPATRYYSAVFKLQK